MKQRTQGLESISVRRANVIDADKVRYRVYSTPAEFIAVIAESALMAVKVSGIKKPHKIVRDLPTEGIAIEAKKMAEKEINGERVNFSMKKSDAPKQIIAELATTDPKEKQVDFHPILLKDLQPKGPVRARILPPELLSQIIDEHTKAVAQELASHGVDEPIESLKQAMVAPPPSQSEELKVPEPAMSTEEKLLQMASEMLPSASPAPAAVEEKLSPDEVEKLLNG